MNTRLYAVLLLITVLCAIAGILTLAPAAGASYPNVFGYKSLCTFAPAATLWCFLAAGITCTLRASLVKRAAYNGGKPVFKAVAIIVLAVVAALGVASTVWLARIGADYPDGTSASSEYVE